MQGVAATRRYESAAIVATSDGRVVDCGPAREVLQRLPRDTPVMSYANALITAGFIDTHSKRSGQSPLYRNDPRVGPVCIDEVVKSGYQRLRRTIQA